MVKNPIDALIQAKEAKIATAERAIEKLKIEVATLRDACRLLAETVANVPKETDAPDVAAAPSNVLVRGLLRKGRSLSAQWKLVLHDIEKSKERGLDLDEIAALCAKHSIDLKRPTLRAQMSNYVSRGYLGRSGEGRFFLGLGGYQLLGLIKVPAQAGEGDRDPAPTGSRQDGDAGGV